MKVKVQVVIESDGGTTETVENIVCLERGALQPENLGLTLAEAKAILAGAAENHGRTSDHRVSQTTGLLPSLREKAAPQGTPHPCVSYAVRQITVAELCVSITACVSRNQPGPSVPWPTCYLNERRRNCCIWKQSLHP